jgi:predicted DNA-binding transcriptional regulator AlpA
MENTSDFLTDKQVAIMLNMSRRTVWAMTSRGLLPQPIHLTKRLTRWYKPNLDAWLTKHLEAGAREQERLQG